MPYILPIVKTSVLTIIILFSSFILATNVNPETECISVVTSGGGHDFWKDVIKGANQAGDELNVKIYARGPNNELNISGQYSLIKSMMEKGCKGLVLAPNSHDLKQEVTKLKAQGIPTVFIDRDIGGDRISVIKTENFLAGEKAGIEMAKALNGKGKVVVFKQNENVVTTTARENGFIKAAIAHGLEIILDKYIGTQIGEARGEAYKALRGISHIDGIFTPNESTSIAVIKVLQNLKKSKDIIHIGFDSSNVMIDALKSHLIYGFIIQNPYQMGYIGVHTVQNAILNKETPQLITTETIFVNNQNINQAHIIKALQLAPPNSNQ